MEHREFTRVEYSGCASVSLGEEIIFGNLRNISLSGMFLQMNQDMPLKTEVDIKLYNADQSAISVKGCVVRCDAMGVGIQINKLDVNSFSRLRDLVSEKAMNYDQIMSETYKMSTRIH